MKPVMLPPGRAKLSTMPAPTGSATCANTIGTVCVSCLTAVAPWVPVTRMISGVSASNSAALARAGQKQTSGHLQPTSALPPKADIGTQSWNVRFVPKTDILQCGKERRYSIISSAVASNVCGNVRPNVLAVLRFRTRSNFVGCSTGKSDGFVPCSILCTYVALRRKRSGKLAL